MSISEKQQLDAYGSLPAPTSAAPAPAGKSRARRLAPSLALLALFGTYHLLPKASSALSALSAANQTDGFLSGPIGTEAHACGQAPVVAIPKGQEGRGDVFYSEAYGKKEVEQFLGALRIRTEIYDNMAHADVETDPRYDSFIEFHEYLLKTYPKIHKAATLDKPNRLNLVYTFEGENKDLKPLVLTAHQDVVPAQTSLDRWTYPPFEGVYDGEFVFGRGASDCKNSLTGSMAAIEYLLENGWKPKRTVILAWGFDEEIGGPQGAATIGPYLFDKYGQDGIAFLIDEGGSGVSEEYGKTFILPGMGEKGNVSPQIEVRTEGGHSSIPRPHSSIGYLAMIIASVEDQNLFPPTLHTSSPIYSYLSCISTHGTPSLVPDWLTKGLSGKQTQKALDQLAQTFADVRGRVYGEFLVRTSKALTLIEGGIKLNALPENAIATFNSRIDFSQTPEKVLDIYTSALLPFAKDYNLSLISWDKTTVLHNGTEGTVLISISGEQGLNPAPVTELKGTAFEVFSWASQRVFGKGGRETDVIVAPSASTGNTDTKHYWNLTKNIYRFVPRRVDTSLAAHTVDESILYKTHLETIEWYHELVLLFDEVEGDEGF